MENHIQKMSTRKIYFYGKPILINTLILAKATFLSNIFPIPEKVLQNIHKITFKYLQQNKTLEPTARKTLLLPTNKGGLNLKGQEKVRKDIYTYNKDFHQLKNNNIIKSNKTPPFYYRDLIFQIKIQNPNIPNVQNKTNKTYKNILQKGSQDHTIFGERQWKDKITHLNFDKIWKNAYTSYSKPYTKDLLFKFLHHLPKQTVVCI